MQREIEHIKRLYPNAHYQALADGAPESWSFLEPVTDTQVLDFFQNLELHSRTMAAILVKD
jgi:hypothetical protein